jgi:hypothetical protein
VESSESEVSDKELDEAVDDSDEEAEEKEETSYEEAEDKVAGPARNTRPSVARRGSYNSLGPVRA